MKNLRILALFLIILFLSSCLPKWSVLKNNTYASLEEPSNEMARVVFLRPNQIASNVDIIVYAQDQLAGVLPIKSYFTFDVKPGKQVFAGLFAKHFDFVEAELEGGKTYFVLYATYDTFVSKHGKILAIKKDSDLMGKVGIWLRSLKLAELTPEATEQYKVLKDENGSYIMAKPGPLDMRLNLEQLRNEWLEEVKKTKKDKLTPEDGV